MSTETENQNVNDGGEQNQQNEDPNIRNLREKAKRTDTVEAENTNLKQQLALSKAGINLSDKQLLALNAAHDGDLTDPDALRKTAEELNFVQPVEDTSQQEQQAHQQVQNAQTGAVNKGELTPQEAYAQANSPQEVLDEVRRRGGSVADDIE